MEKIEYISKYYKNQSIYKGSELFGIKKMNELLFADKNPSEKYNLLKEFDFNKIIGYF